jgi:hypothetical protein
MTRAGVRAPRAVPPNKRMQLTRRGDRVGVARFARQSSLSRASQLIRGVLRTTEAEPATRQVWLRH